MIWEHMERNFIFMEAFFQSSSVFGLLSWQKHSYPCLLGFRGEIFVPSLDCTCQLIHKIKHFITIIPGETDISSLLFWRRGYFEVLIDLSGWKKKSFSLSVNKLKRKHKKGCRKKGNSVLINQRETYNSNKGLYTRDRLHPVWECIFPALEVNFKNLLAFRAMIHSHFLFPRICKNVAHAFFFSPPPLTMNQIITLVGKKANSCTERTSQTFG